MVSTFRNKWADYVVFGLSVFLIFCLVFDLYIALPALVGWIGHWHPLVVHFPIVLLLLAIFLGLTGKPIPRDLLNIAVISGLLTAILGFFLGKETAVQGDLLFWHQWLGAAVALLAALWYWLAGLGLGRKLYVKGLQVVLIGMVAFAGHFGGMVTHGSDFLALPTDPKLEKIPENPLIYQDVVGRILEHNCVSCHNPNKRKGALLMTGLPALLKGGETGNTLVPGDPTKSEMIKRLRLPENDEGHMPPDGKKPLGDDDIRILERWISLGASDTLRLDHLTSGEPLWGLVKGKMQPDASEHWATLPVVADSTLQRLSSDYMTIERIAGNTNALSIDVFLSPTYQPKDIVSLESIAQNIVELDLSGLPIGSGEMVLIGACNNLEWLELDRTTVTDMDMENLKNLSNLRLLKIFDTGIGDKSLTVFKHMENLKSLYLWGTEVSGTALEALSSERPDLMIDNGIDKEIKAFFVTRDTIPIK